MKPLNALQQRWLVRLFVHGPAISPSPMQTLNALEKRGLVFSAMVDGAVQFTLTSDGMTVARKLAEVAP